MRLNKLGLIVGCTFVLGVATGCPAGDDDDVDAGTPDSGSVTPDGGSTTPDSGEVVGQVINLNFCIDDSANGTYAQADGLAWKGSFSYDATTNKITHDPSWGGPFVNLWDDGPLSANGHEPEGSTAGDNIWCNSAEFDVPADSDTNFEYGAIRGSVDGSDGDWIWQGSNGTFTVTANQMTDVDVTGLTIAPFGTIDLRLTIDTSTLADEFSTFDPANGITVKSSGWGWTEIDCVDDGTAGDETADDGIFTFVLGENTGPGSGLPHAGLLMPGQEAEFVFTLGGVEYKVAGVPPLNGVAAEVNAGNGWGQVTVTNKPDGDQNTFITVPADLFAPPADHVAFNFSIDDSANQTYGAMDGLAWKGSFSYDATTRVMTHDPAWGGPFVVLYDDGPWSAGGHEPAGAVANDNIWGIAAFFASPAADVNFEYGAIRGSVDGSDGDWIWQGSNGTFTVPMNATAPIDVVGLTIAPHGDIDFRLTIDANNLAPEFSAFDPANGITVKSSGWGWSEIDCLDDGTNGDETSADGVFTFVLSENVGAGTTLPHSGLLASGDEPEFVFVLGGVEYKVSGAPSAMGVGAATLPPGGAWTAATIESRAMGDQNTYITVP